MLASVLFPCVLSYHLPFPFCSTVQLAEFVGPSPLSSVSAGGLDLSSLSQKMNKLSSSDRRIDDGDVDLLGDLPSPSDPFSNVTEELNICTGDGKRRGIGVRYGVKER